MTPHQRHLTIAIVIAVLLLLFGVVEGHAWLSH
jgi:hypothetical protein